MEISKPYRLFRVVGKNRYPNGAFANMGEAEKARDNVVLWHGEGTKTVIEKVGDASEEPGSEEAPEREVRSRVGEEAPLR